MIDLRGFPDEDKKPVGKLTRKGFEEERKDFDRKNPGGLKRDNGKQPATERATKTETTKAVASEGENGKEKAEQTTGRQAAPASRKGESTKKAVGSSSSSSSSSRGDARKVSGKK